MIEELVSSDRDSLFCDGSETGYGFMIKCNDIFVKIYYKGKKYKNNCNTIESEFISLKQGLIHCLYLEKKKLYIYTDNDTVYKLLRDKKVKYKNKIVDDVLSLLQKFNYVGLKFDEKTEVEHKFVDKLSREKTYDVYSVTSKVKERQVVRKVELIELTEEKTKEIIEKL